MSKEQKTSEDLLIGNFLKMKREEKNISLVHVSQSTKINPTILENLESNNFDSLPDKAYLSGFVKSYSRLLGVNVSDSLEILENTYRHFYPETVPQDEEQSEENEIKQEVQKISAEKNLNKMEKKGPSFTPKPTHIIPVILIGFVIYGVTQLQGDNTEQAAPVEPLVKTEVLTEETPLKEGPAPKIEVAIKDDEPEEIEEENTTPENELKKETVKEEVEDKKDKNEEEKEELTFSPLPVPMFQNADISEEDKNSLLPTSVQANFKEGLSNLYIIATDGDTWITYKKADDETRKFILQKGKTLLIQSSLIRMFMGNAHATKIFYNGQYIKPLTKSGVKSLVFPPEKASEFKIPLFIFNKDGSVTPSDEYLNNQDEQG